MAKNEKGEVIYRCPMCLNRLVDVVIDKYEDGKYHCAKCGFVASEEIVKEKYDEFRSRYRLIDKRITLEEQKFI